MTVRGEMLLNIVIVTFTFHFRSNFSQQQEALLCARADSINEIQKSLLCGLMTIKSILFRL